MMKARTALAIFFAWRSRCRSPARPEPSLGGRDRGLGIVGACRRIEADDLLGVRRIDVPDAVGASQSPASGYDGASYSVLDPLCERAALAKRRLLRALLALMLSNEGFHHAHFFAGKIFKGRAD